jgi:hypothetical protein
MKMRYKRTSAFILTLLVGILPAAFMVGANEEPSVTIPFTDPGDVVPGMTKDDMVYAVYFADNMAFAPQWRTGNLVRIEIMVLKVYNLTDPDGSPAPDDIPVTVNTNITSGTVYDQATLMANPEDLLYTWMVSVPSIEVTIAGENGDVFVYESDFTDGYDDADTVGREINKAGHLIYGFLWDTSADDASAGVYRVSVKVPGYDVAFSVRSLVLGEEELPIGYEAVPIGAIDAFVSGTGGVDATLGAYIFLGELIEKSDSGSNGGNGGDSGQNGNGGDGDNGQNGNGGMGKKRK